MKLRIFFTLILTYLFIFNLGSFAVEEVDLEDNNTEVQTEDESKTLTSKISYDDVIKKSKDHAYDLKIADFEVLISKQAIRSARSEYFPKLNVGAGSEYTKNFRDIKESTVMSIGDAFINPYTRYQTMFGVTLSYNLFDFGVRKGRMDIAKEDVKLKELDELQKFQDLSLNVLDTYSKISMFTKQLELYNQILELENKNLEYKERLFNAKEISKTDYDDAKVEVSKTKTRIADLKSELSESLNWLSFYTGESYDIDNLQVDDLKKSDFDVMEFQDYTKTIIWQMHEKELKKKELEVKIAKRNYLPKINAYGRYYLYGSDHSSYTESVSGIEPSNFTVGGSINMPVFDGFQNSANVQTAILEYKQLQVERDKAIAEFMTKLAVMRSNLMYIDDQLENNKTAVDELESKNKSVAKLVNKKVASPVEEIESKIALLQETIELEKNKVTSVALTKGIQILTDYNN